MYIVYKCEAGASSVHLDLHVLASGIARTVLVKMYSLLPALSFLGAALAAPTSYSASNSSTPTAVVKNGTISGRHSDTYNQDFFLGIPYAQPPVNELRFRNPQSLNTTFNSTLEATDYAHGCVGYGV